MLRRAARGLTHTVRVHILATFPGCSPWQPNNDIHVGVVEGDRQPRLLELDDGGCHEVNGCVECNVCDYEPT